MVDRAAIAMYHWDGDPSQGQGKLRIGTEVWITGSERNGWIRVRPGPGQEPKAWVPLAYLALADDASATKGGDTFFCRLCDLRFVTAKALQRHVQLNKSHKRAVKAAERDSRRSSTPDSPATNTPASTPPTEHRLAQSASVIDHTAWSRQRAPVHQGGVAAAAPMDPHGAASSSSEDSDCDSDDGEDGGPPPRVGAADPPRRAGGGSVKQKKQQKKRGSRIGSKLRIVARGPSLEEADHGTGRQSPLNASMEELYGLSDERLGRNPSLDVSMFAPGDLVEVQPAPNGAWHQAIVNRISKRRGIVVITTIGTGQCIEAKPSLLRLAAPTSHSTGAIPILHARTAAAPTSQPSSPMAMSPIVATDLQRLDVALSRRAQSLGWSPAQTASVRAKAVAEVFRRHGVSPPPSLSATPPSGRASPLASSGSAPSPPSGVIAEVQAKLVQLNLLLSNGFIAKADFDVRKTQLVQELAAAFASTKSCSSDMIGSQEVLDQMLASTTRTRRDMVLAWAKDGSEKPPSGGASAPSNRLRVSSPGVSLSAPHSPVTRKAQSSREQRAHREAQSAAAAARKAVKAERLATQQQHHVRSHSTDEVKLDINQLLASTMRTRRSLVQEAYRAKSGV